MAEFEYLSVRHMAPVRIAEGIPDRLGVPMKPGKKLPNGAIILEQRKLRSYDFRMDLLVLALVEGGANDPFISWHRLITTDSPLADGNYHIVDTCAWGEYSTTLEVAMEKYEKRWVEKLDSLQV